MHPTDLEKYFKDRLAQLDWNAITEAMHQHGFVVLEKFLTEEQCDLAKNNYDHPSLYRKTVNMQRYRFGLGEYKYFTYPLPHLIHQCQRHSKIDPFYLTNGKVKLTPLISY